MSKKKQLARTRYRRPARADDSMELSRATSLPVTVPVPSVNGARSLADQDRIDELLSQRVVVTLGTPGDPVNSSGKVRQGGIYTGRVVGWEHGRYNWPREADGYYIVVLDAFPGEWLNAPVRQVRRA